MHRLISKRTFCSPNSLIYSCLPYQLRFTHIGYSFSSNKPDNQENTPKDQQKKMKITYGNKYRHPLRTNLMKDIQTNFRKIGIKLFTEKIRQQQQKDQTDQKKNIQQTIQQKMKQFMNQSKKQQNSEKDKKSDNQNQDQPKPNRLIEITKRILIGYLVLTFISTMLREDNSQRDIYQSRKGTSEILIKQISLNPQVIKVLIQKSFYTKSGVSLITVSNKKADFTLEENELVDFLEKLEGIRNGSIQVQFTFHPVQLDGTFSKSRKEQLNFAVKVLFFGALIFIFRRMSREMGSGVQEMFQMKKFKPVKPQSIQILFKDVAGMHQAKFQVTQFVDFLKQPEKYIDMGAKVPKGALLTGPPGTGKTLLAKACAGQAGVPFFYVSGSDFVERFSGLGASRVRSLFDQAEKNSPSIIFIDQIDAIGKKRDSGPFSNEERDNTLNQLLVRMDGFDTQNKVIVMAATNRKDMLDPALLRPGRFDRSVEIGIPNFEERKQILKVHLKKVKYDPKITQDDIAKRVALITPGFSGAQLANTCNQAAILAARQDLDFITFQNFEKATERVMAGLQKRNIFTQEQKQMLAYYQCGKAVISWFTQGSDPVIKISILPFSKSNKGFSHSIRDQTALNTMEQLLDKACCYLAGRAAQNHFQGYVTTNGEKDLERARKIITYIVTKFGMSQPLNMIAFPDFDFTRKPYSEKTQSIIDDEIRRLTENVQKRVQDLIKQKQEQIKLLKDQLLKKQTLTHNDIKKILGERPFESNQNYNKYLQDQQQQAQSSGEQGPGSITATKPQNRSQYFV